MHVIHVTMKVLESSLDPARFVRIHRSHIVKIELSSGERLRTGPTCGETIRGMLTNSF